MDFPNAPAAGNGERDDDSALGDETLTETTSMGEFAESITKNGRTYHSYRPGKYPWPNDERERDRLDFEHQLLKILLDDKLRLAPIAENPHKVLDVGTGTGIWAIDFADEHPTAEVIGIDLSHVQPEWVPPNCRFFVDDCEDVWLDKNLDFIHMRGMNGSIKDWPGLLSQAFEFCRPGGWIELEDWLLPHPRNHTRIDEWRELLMEAASQDGRDLSAPSSFSRMLEEVGFGNAKEEIFQVPQNERVKNLGSKERELGRRMLADCIEGVEGASMELMTGLLGKSVEEVQELCRDVLKEMQSGDINARWNRIIVYAQKPK